MDLVWALLLIAVLVVAWLLTLLGMPGNWLMVIASAVYAYLMPEISRADLGVGVVVGLLVLAVLGEVVEFAAGALGVAQAGGSRRGAALAILGSVLGGLVGILVGVPFPIPLVGSLVAAVLFAGIGAMTGALLGEQWKGRTIEESWKSGKAAFWGRLWGTLAKTLIATVMVVVAVIALAM